MDTASSAFLFINFLFKKSSHYSDAYRQFIPVLFEFFSSFYHVLDTDMLNVSTNQILGVETESILNSAELEQIDRWNPETIGQIIFNNWD